MSDVVLLAENYSYTAALDGVTGTKKYIDASAYTGASNATSETLPALGTAWSNAYSNLIASNITETYLDNNPNCGVKIYDVQYSTFPYSKSTIGTLYPTTIEMSADFQTYEDSRKSYSNGAGAIVTGHWYFSDNDRANDFKLRKREITTTIVIHKLIEDSNVSGFVTKSQDYVGKVNQDAGTVNGIDVGAEQLLYIGFTASEQQNESNKEWLCQLKFVMKSVEDPAGGGGFVGWNYVFRPETGKYDKVKFMVGDPLVFQNYLYDTVADDFDGLIKFSES